jgi:hypothetical protein
MRFQCERLRVSEKISQYTCSFSYGSEFFQQVVQPGDFYSLAGVVLATGEIASLAVAEVVEESDLNAEVLLQLWLASCPVSTN